jgi:hypothetical protein
LVKTVSREQSGKQLDWLARNADDISTQSHLLFQRSRENNRRFYFFKIVETHNIHIPMHLRTIKKQYCSDVDQAGNISGSEKSRTLCANEYGEIKWANH